MTSAKELKEMLDSINWNNFSDEELNYLRSSFEMKQAELKWTVNRRKHLASGRKKK